MADVEKQQSPSNTFFGLHLLKTQDEFLIHIYVDMETRKLDVELKWKRDVCDSSLFVFPHALKR